MQGAVLADAGDRELDKAVEEAFVKLRHAEERSALKRASRIVIAAAPFLKKVEQLDIEDIAEEPKAPKAEVLYKDGSAVSCFQSPA